MKPDPGPPRKRVRAKPKVLTVRHGQAVLVETANGKGRRTLRISAGKGTKLTPVITLDWHDSITAPGLWLAETPEGLQHLVNYTDETLPDPDPDDEYRYFGPIPDRR